MPRMLDDNAAPGRARRLAGLVAIALMWLAVPPQAHAQDSPRVAVARFSGSRAVARKARLAVIRALGDRYDLIPVKQLDRAMKKGGYKKVTAANAVDLTSAVSGDAVVAGDVTRAGKGYELTVTVYAGWSGKAVAEAAIPIESRRVRKPDQTAIRREITAVMARFDDRWADKNAALDAVETDSSDAVDEAGAPDASEPSAVTRSSSGSWRDDVHGVVLLGGSFIGRRLRFDYPDSIPRSMRPFEYNSVLAFGASLGTEVYPFALVSAVPDSIGVWFTLDRSVALSSELGDQTFGTVQSRWGMGATYRLTLGDRASPLTLLGRLGFSQQRHHIDIDPGLISLPDVTYSMIDLGLGARVPLAYWKLRAVHVDVRLLPVLGTGDISSADNYGGTSGTGLHIDVAAELAAISQIQVRVGLRMSRLGLSFDGTGALTELDQMGDPDVTGASDTYLGGYLTAGYRF